MNAISHWYVCKYREQASISGYEQAARNLRKQGCPVWLALEILLRARI